MHILVCLFMQMMHIFIICKCTNLIKNHQHTNMLYSIIFYNDVLDNKIEIVNMFSIRLIK